MLTCGVRYFIEIHEAQANLPGVFEPKGVANFGTRCTLHLM